MNRALSPWIRLLGLTGGMIAAASITASLRWHFGFPIAHYRAMPLGTPLWWSLVRGASAAVLAVLWLLAARSAMDLIREWSIAQTKVEQWWARKPGNTLQTGGVPSSRSVLRLVFFFLGLSLGFWAIAVWMISRCWFTGSMSCWLAIAVSGSVGATILVIIQTAWRGVLGLGGRFGPQSVGRCSRLGRRCAFCCWLRCFSWSWS